MHKWLGGGPSLFFISARATRRDGGPSKRKPSAPFFTRKKRVNYSTIFQKLHIHGSTGITPVMPSYYTVLHVLLFPWTQDCGGLLSKFLSIFQPHLVFLNYVCTTQLAALWMPCLRTHQLLSVTAFKSPCYRHALKHRAVKSPPTGLTLLTDRGEFQRWSSCFRASRVLGLRGFVFVFVFQLVVRLREPELSVHLIRLNPRSRLTLAAIWSSDGSSVPARKLKWTPNPLFRTLTEIRAVTCKCFRIQLKPPVLPQDRAPSHSAGSCTHPTHRSFSVSSRWWLAADSFTSVIICEPGSLHSDLTSFTPRWHGTSHSERFSTSHLVVT